MHAKYPNVFSPIKLGPIELRNRFYSLGRRRKWQADYDQEIIERTLVAPDDQQSTVELEDVRRALAMLPDFQREALILVGAGGLSYDEAAEVAGAAVGTMKSRVSRARDALALIYAEGDIVTDGGLPGYAMAAILQQVATLTGRTAS